MTARNASFGMLRRGAKGYLLKDTEPSELIKAIRETRDKWLLLYTDGGPPDLIIDQW